MPHQPHGKLSTKVTINYYYWGNQANSHSPPAWIPPVTCWRRTMQVWSSCRQVCNAQAINHISNNRSALVSLPPTNCSGKAPLLYISLESCGDLKKCFLLKEPFLFTVEYSWILQVVKHTQKVFFFNSWGNKPKEDVYLILLADLI